MGFDNNYPNRKDRRQPYRRSKRHTKSCRNHGSCAWCQGNRNHGTEKREPIKEEPDDSTQHEPREDGIGDVE